MNNFEINTTAFLPTTRAEMAQRGWDRLDVILITGDSYIDSPYIGAAVIGRVLEKAGYKVGIIAQPAVNVADDITRLGEPRLFWGITGGSVDSMVANYSANRWKRKSDDYTPVGVNGRRPDRAVIVYCNMIRRFYKNTSPLLIGGIEASLRRIAHYDFWTDSVRRSILFDAKADYLLYGMADQSVVDFAQALDRQEDPRPLRGLAYIAKDPPSGFLELPAYETVISDKLAFIDSFHLFYHNQDPHTAKGLIQRHADRFLVQNPPYPYPTQAALDAVYDLPYTRDQHPFYAQQGEVKALETIRFSINTHHGCYGECNFCAIAVHEGRTVRWRSEESILREAELISHLPGFKGYILDAGGPTANMYGFECKKKLEKGACEDKRCIYPNLCPMLKPDHERQIRLLRRLRQLPGIKKVFVASGLRYDLILADGQHGEAYLEELVEHHVSGQLKVAPEHSENRVLEKMGKPGQEELIRFKQRFDDLCMRTHKNQFLTYYLIAAHPGCTDEDMRRLKQFCSQELHLLPEQVQIFTPTPSTYSSLMYYTGLDPFSRQPIFVEKDILRRELQKEIIVGKPGAQEKDHHAQNTQGKAPGAFDRHSRSAYGKPKSYGRKPFSPKKSDQ